MSKMNVYNVTFKGYRRDCNASTLPDYSGIFMIYRCKYNPDNDTVTLLELFYIGQSKNLNNEVNYHARHEEFLKEAKVGEEICYAYAKLPESSLDIIENALVFSQKPRLNTYLKDNFNHSASEFHIDGNCALLNYTDFTIE